MSTYVFHFELDTPPARDKLLCATLDGQHLRAERVSFQGPARLAGNLCTTRASLSLCGVGLRAPPTSLHISSSPPLSPGGVLETTEECIQLSWSHRAAWQVESAQQALSSSAAQRQELLLLGAMEMQLEEHQLSPGLWTA